jgi:hypothetical protein
MIMSARILMIDITRANLMVVLTSSIHFYHIDDAHHCHRTPSKFSNRINLYNNYENHWFQYDIEQSFVIYYDVHAKTLDWYVAQSIMTTYNRFLSSI